MMAGQKEKLQTVVLKTLLQGLGALPRPYAAGIGTLFGRIWHGLDRYHRQIARENMLGAFAGELDREGVDRLVRANFIRLVRMFLEIPFLTRLTRQNMDDYVVFEGVEHARSAMASGKGVLFLTAHLGNWELMSLAAPLKLGQPMNIMVRPLDSPPVDRLITGLRTRTGNRVLDKDKSAGAVASLLKKGEAVGILLDQNASWFEGVYVPFFGRVACTNKGLAMFALRYKAQVVPVFNLPMADGRYRVIFSPPVDLVRSGDIGRDIIANTERFNRIIEAHIRMAPTAWFWVHRRWRIKPVPPAARKKIRGHLPLSGEDADMGQGR